MAQEAIAALEVTQNAIAAIEQGKTQEAIQAMERATGKIDILVVRYPELALVPVSTQVAVIDVAPLDVSAIERIRNQIKSAINAENYPAARELLNNLMSEIRTTTLNLPLVTYPDAMKEAARLLNDGQTEQAQSVLLNMIDHLVDKRGYTLQQAYAICSVAVDLKVSQIVDVPNFLVSAFLPLEIFV